MIGHLWCQEGRRALLLPIGLTTGMRCGTVVAYKEITMQQATPEQIQWFREGAAARYQELGVKSAEAGRLLDTHIAKIADELGIRPINPAAARLAAGILDGLQST